MFDGVPAATRRLPFHFQAQGGVGRLALDDLAVGLVSVDRLELEVSDLGTDPGATAAERFQRRRTRLRGLALRITQAGLDSRIEQVRKPLAALGVTQLAARLNDGYVSVRARAADGLAAADLSLHVYVMAAGAQLRALASAIRVHGHLPTPGPVIADRLLTSLFGATDGERVADRPHVRGLCDLEIDLVGALLWQMLPPNGWRLPAVTEIELTHIRVARAAIEISYGPVGTRGGELGVRPHTHQLAAAHDLMHSVDDQLRGGHLEDAMRGYRALLASSGPDQPLLLERILSLASARPAWFFDGLELARQALGRWPKFAPAHAALSSITLAQGDAREAAKHLEDVARMASGDGDDDQAALAALAGARLLRVLDPRAATQLYQLALEHDPTSLEAADSLADRLADEERWPELVRLVRLRAGATTDPARTVPLHLRLADVFVHQLDDLPSAQHELDAARLLAPDDPAVHEMTATILVASDPAAATRAWREVARLAEQRGDHRTCARAWARIGDLINAEAMRAAGGTSPGLPSGLFAEAEAAWRRSLELDPLQSDALVGLAGAAAARNDHDVAADLYERLRGLGLAQVVAARHELALARSLVALGRIDDARASLRRATLVATETAAEAHAMLAELADQAMDHDHASAELEIAIGSLIGLAADRPPDVERLNARAAELAVMRAMLLDRTGHAAAAAADWQRAYALAQDAAPEVARDAARTLLARSGDDAGVERRWVDAVLATQPPPADRAALLVRRADLARRDRTPEAALADLREALELADEAPAATVAVRRRAHRLEADLHAQRGDLRARAQALASLALLAERATDRVEAETAAATAWLAADDPAAALPHGARAHAALQALSGALDDVAGSVQIGGAVRREVATALGEAAWRQRAWPDAIRAYRALIDDAPAGDAGDAARLPTYRYRLAVAADRAGDAEVALGALRPLIDDPDASRGASPELRAQALRLFADLAERTGDLMGAAAALESFAAIGGDSSAAARADAVYRAGELFRRAERLDEAIRCYEAALRISDSHLPALDALEAMWRDRKDLERVAAILGRKVAATGRHPARQKPLLSRLGDLQDQLGRPDVARETHQRALEIDPMWRPSLRYVTLGLRDAGQVVAAAGGLAQLAGELHGDHGVDLAIVTRERQIAAEALAELVAKLDDAQLDAVRAVARPALERAALDNADVRDGLARLRGETSQPSISLISEDSTQSGKAAGGERGGLSLRDAAARARADGKLDEAFATLETADHVNPGDPGVLRELVELATQLGDHAAAARHLSALAHRLSAARRGDALLELADVFYDKLDDAVRGREAMRKAADAFGSGSRRDATLRMLATEAGTHLAWDIVVESLRAIPVEKQAAADVTSLATALLRAGRDAEALAAVQAATDAGRYDDGGELAGQLQYELQRKTELARTLEDRASAASPDEAQQLRDEAQQLRIAIGQPGDEPLRDTAVPDGEAPRSDTAPWPVRTKTKPGLPSRGVAPAPVARTTAMHDAVEPLVEDATEAERAERAEPAAAEPAESVTRATKPLGRIKLATRQTTKPRISATRPPGETVTHEVVIAPEPASAPAPAPAPALAVEPHDAAEATTPVELGDDAPTEAVATPGHDDAIPESDETSGGWQSVSSPNLTSSPTIARELSGPRLIPPPPPVIPPPVIPPPVIPPAVSDAPPIAAPSVTITGTPEETALALFLAAASADRDRLFAARRAEPDDPAMLLALLAHLGDREPALRAELLDEVVRTSHGRAQAIALHEQALVAREAHEPARATALWTRAHQADPNHPPVWMPLADALAAADDYDTARELYDMVARSDHYDAQRRAFAAERAEALGRDESIVSGEIKPRSRQKSPPTEPPALPAVPAPSDLPTPPPFPTPAVPDHVSEARAAADREDWPSAIDAAERAATTHPRDVAVLELLEQVYFASGNVPQASEAIGRQLLLVEDPAQRAQLWRRRARMYRDVLGRDAEAYRCLKEAHACAPADPEIAYQLRTAAMVRGEWPLTAQLLYREIAAATNPRDRGALHLELALIYEERLDDYAQAQANYEQALAFDPTIPAVKLPLARRYEAIGRLGEAARLYEEAAASARAADRAGLLESAARCRVAALGTSDPDVAAQLDRAEVAGDLDAAAELAQQLWRAEPGHPAAFRVLAGHARTQGDLPALTDLTRTRAARAPNPDDRAMAWLEVARLAEELSAHDQAARAYDLALIEDPGNASALDARGALAFRLADFATADLIYRDLGAGESVLGDDELALRRSIIAEQLGRDAEALQLARDASELAPGRRDLMSRVGDLALRVGDTRAALGAARAVLELVPLDDDEGRLAAHLMFVDLLRQAGDLDEATGQLERVLRDHPVHPGVIEALAQVHGARGDWASATRYLYMLVPLAPSPALRAERLYQLGEIVLTQVHDFDRADDVFLRASDLDPGHVPTLRRLLDVYWRADDPGGIVEVAIELADKDALSGPITDAALGHALVAAALIGDTPLSGRLLAVLGDRAPRLVVDALSELAGKTGRLQLGSAATAVAELARRGVLDLAKLRAAAAGTPAANAL